jgi:hypothetical protein
MQVSRDQKDRGVSWVANGCGTQTSTPCCDDLGNPDYEKNPVSCEPTHMLVQ